MKNSLKPILWGGLGEKTSNNGRQFYQQRRIYEADSIAMCHPSQIPGGSYMYRIGDDNMERIRKLTPCECWRLQGFSKITKTEDGYEFDDTLFKRAESVNSNTQLYKQAGNSITVNVLEHIFTNLFITMSYDAPEGQMTFNDI